MAREGSITKIQCEKVFFSILSVYILNIVNHKTILMALKISAWEWSFLIGVVLFFIWLFYKGYMAYKKNGWNDPFFNNDDFGGNVSGF